jgi:small redox-active disulfide protein 2
LAQAVRDLPEEVRTLIEVREWDMRTRVGLVRARELKARSLPAMALDGHLVFESIIPDLDELIGRIRGFHRRKNRSERQMKIEVLGRGCPKCDQLLENASQAVEQAGLADSAQVVKIKDEGYFLEKGVFVTPGLIVDGKVVSSGRLLNPQEILDIIKGR